MTPTKIAIFGAGHVGAAFGFALLRSELATEIVLIDPDTARAEGEAMDMDHAVPFGRPARVWAGTPSDCAGAAIVVVTAGGGQRPGQTRLDLAVRNAEVLRAIVPLVAAYAPDAVLIIATNPVDVLTMGALALSGFPSARVIGSGTVLDSARLRFMLSARLGVDARNIHANVIGEHGDSEVFVGSSATVAGLPLSAVSHTGPFEDADQRAIARQTRDAAASVIQRKGHTAFAIAAALVRIVAAVVGDEKSVLTVSTHVDGPYGLEGVSLSLPCVVGRGGVEHILTPKLNPAELAALLQSAATIRAAAGLVGFAQ